MATPHGSVGIPHRFTATLHGSSVARVRGSDMTRMGVPTHAMTDASATPTCPCVNERAWSSWFHSVLMRAHGARGLAMVRSDSGRRLESDHAPPLLPQRKGLLKQQRGEALRCGTLCRHHNEDNEWSPFLLRRSTRSSRRTQVLLRQLPLMNLLRLCLTPCAPAPQPCVS
jgi:hypothetical protein